ncbi:hypothetical protein ACS0TY_018904 [Phlomoides rotata]
MAFTYACNPITREYIELALKILSTHILKYEFGTSKTTSQYKESRIHEFVISKSPNFLREYYEVVYPIKIFKDGDILMAWGDFFLFYYSVSSSKAKTITNIDMFELRGPGAIDSILHTRNCPGFGSPTVHSTAVHSRSPWINTHPHGCVCVRVDPRDPTVEQHCCAQ